MTENDPPFVEQDYVLWSTEDSAPHNDLKDLHALQTELNKESDRGAALIACSYIDDLMQQLLYAYLIEGGGSRKVVEALVAGFSAPLGTLSTRNAMAYALGLIAEKEFRDYEIMRRVRNKFAHAVHVSFESQEVIDLCANLSIKPFQYDPAQQKSSPAKLSPRAIYTITALDFILGFKQRLAAATQKRQRAENTSS